MTLVDRAIGTSSWRSQVQSANDVPKLIDFLKQSLAGVGYTGNKVRTPAIKNTVQGVLYHMVFAAKHPLGDQVGGALLAQRQVANEIWISFKTRSLL